MAKHLFEVSWEVCNKIGGIHTTLATKARNAVAEFSDNYIVVGPLLDKNAEFSEETDEFSARVVKALAEKGIVAKAGRWNVSGNPRCVLVNYKSVAIDQDRLLYHMWEHFGVDSMFGQWDYLEPVLFSTVCGMAVENVSALFEKDAVVTVHFHEWMTGAGLLHVKQHMPSATTVFTTHSTVLGRCLAGAGGDIYMVMDELNSAQEAKKYGVSAKFSLENVTARQADCFTAVSQMAANESLALLGVNPTLVTPNGLDLQQLPDYSRDPEAFGQKRAFLIDFASRFLKKQLNGDTTRFLAIAGSYEFQKKGVDVFLESLHILDEQLRKTPGNETTVVALLLLQGGFVGVHEEALLRLQRTFDNQAGSDLIATHHLTDKHNDPVLNACSRLGLLNRSENRCHVIFVPATLDGTDGVLNVPYHDVVAGCDFGVFPSNYEPDGYVPLHSIALGVPAVSSDKSGFGEWVLEHFPNKPGVFVVERQGKQPPETSAALAQWLSDAIAWDENRLSEWKRAARAIAAEASWDKLFASYRDAYEKGDMARRDRIAGMRKQHDDSATQTFIAPTNSNQPRLRSLSVVSELPGELKELENIAYTMWWVWNRSARELFKRLDPIVWDKVNSNPVALLQQVDDTRLKEVLDNDSYMQLYRNVVQQFKAATEGTKCRIETLKHATRKNPIAYFSMEFGIHECLPIYSGGLGILSGDHLKSASDLNIPLVGIGLLYKFGYFVQRISRVGDQIALYEENNFAQMPIRPELRGGQRVRIAVELPGRQVHAQIWRVQVGTVPLFLLDTDVDENSQKDRYLTSKLYDSSTRERIEQEILLGIGGVTALRALSIDPSVYHLNEGHSSFLLVEQLKILMKDQGLDFDTAREVVRARSVFTTHTPVPAGNERFHRSLIENYFRQYVEQAGITWEQFWNLGHIYSGDDSDFEMTVLALKMCSRYNGVSRLHGAVARTMWQHVWRGFLADEAPIGHITNGVHCGSWIADEMRGVLETYAGIDMENALLDQTQWERIEEVPSNVIWQTHNTMKSRLFELVRQTVQQQWSREGEDPSLIEQFRVRLNPGAFTIGFARRIATYKRPLLLLKDIERLRRLVKNEKYPVQILFAGKAHPADREAASLIREIVRISKEPDFLGRLVFIEGYNIRLARALVSGVDLWLNNPVRPMEASGTSGMKAAMNGVINCSILDGWWDECFEEDKQSGWAIGDGVQVENRESQDMLDSENLYDLLDERIIPAYYSRNARNTPEQWIHHMKHAMMASLRQYNTHRMLRDYATDMYEPSAAFSGSLSKSDYSRARAVGEWKKKLPARFASLSLREVRIDGVTGNVLNVKDRMRVKAIVEPGKMRPNEFSIEIVVQDAAGGITCAPMILRKTQGAALTFEGEFIPPRTGQFKYGIRAVPNHADLVTRYDSSMVSWG